MPESSQLTFLTGVEIATVYSPYSPTECRDRLNARLEIERRKKAEGYEIFGSADHSFLRIGIAGTAAPDGGSGWRAYLSGTMAEYNGGTRIRCRLGAGDGLAVAMGAIVFLIWAAFAAAIARNPAGFWNGNPLFIVAIPLVLSLLIAGTGHLVGVSARRRSRTLLHLLNSTLGGGERHQDRTAAIEDLWRNA